MDVWHKVDSGEFARNGKNYKYVVEQNKNNVPKKDSSRNIRVRVIDEKPEVTKVRTRYDPFIETYGVQNASMPLSLGYSIKHLKASVRSFWIMVAMFGLMFAQMISMYIFKFDFMKFAVSPITPVINISPVITGVIFNILIFLVYGWFIYKIFGKMLCHYFQTKDVIKELKNAGKWKVEKNGTI